MSLPSRYPVAAGAVAGLVAFRSVATRYLAVWFDLDPVGLAGYTTALGWISFLLLPVGVAAVGYAGGRAAAGRPDLVRAGGVCLGVGLVASAAAVGLGPVVRPTRVSPVGADYLLRWVASAGLTVVRTASVGAVAFVAGAALAAER